MTANASILFCTPCYGGMAFAPHMKSCLELCRELTEQGIAFDWLLRWNESLVHRARMGMTAQFLQTDHTHMMWLDADIEFTPEDVAKVWNMDADIGVGVYRMKTPESKYAAWVDGKLVEDLGQFTGPVAVDYAGTGFMMIKREAAQKLISHLDAVEAKYRAILEDLPERDRGFMERFIPFSNYENEMKNIPALYMTPISGGTLLSEDYFFCELVRESGLRVMMDPTVKLTHWGITGYGGPPQ